MARSNYPGSVGAGGMAGPKIRIHAGFVKRQLALFRLTSAAPVCIFSASIARHVGRYPSGQRGQTVNLLADAFGGSNPPLPTISRAPRPSSNGGVFIFCRGRSVANRRFCSRTKTGGNFVAVSQSSRELSQQKFLTSIPIYYNLLSLETFRVGILACTTRRSSFPVLRGNSSVG